jgi:hypothetical protein
MYAYLGTEIVRIDTINQATLVCTIGRGVLDTVAVPHAIGDRLFIAQGWEASDDIERVSGDVANVKLLPSTGRGVLLEASAPTDNVTVARRKDRPYPPGQFRINTAAYPATVTTLLSVSWAIRDRTTQNLQGDETGNIGPEAGVTYTVQVYNDVTNALLDQQTGLISTAATFPNVVGTFRARVELWSVRTTFASRQKHVHVFNLAIPAAGKTLTATASFIRGNASSP